MAGPVFAPVDEETSDLLSLVADVEHPVGRDAVTAFLDACKADAAANDGYVSVNNVRARLASQGLLGDSEDAINPRRLSAFWSAFTGRNKPMVKTGEWETCQGSTSGNDGRPFCKRRWVGVVSESDDRSSR